MTPATVLRRAAARVRMGWTQDVYARDGNGERVPAADPRAACWCAMGAIDAETPVDTDPCHAVVALTMIVGVGAADWNDAPGRTAEEVALAMEAAADAWEAGNPGAGRVATR